MGYEAVGELLYMEKEGRERKTLKESGKLKE